MLVIVFAAAGSGVVDARALLAYSAAMSLIGGAVMLALALVLVLAFIVRSAPLQLEKEAA